MGGALSAAGGLLKRGAQPPWACAASLAGGAAGAPGPPRRGVRARGGDQLHLAAVQAGAGGGRAQAGAWRTSRRAGHLLGVDGGTVHLLLFQLAQSPRRCRARRYQAGESSGRYRTGVRAAVATRARMALRSAFARRCCLSADAACPCCPPRSAPSCLCLFVCISTGGAAGWLY